MGRDQFKAKAYLREGCPFSFKFLLFATEAPDFQTIKSKLQAGLHEAAAFPTVELELGRHLSESDALIEYYATRNGIEVSRLPALSFYIETIFPRLLPLHESDAT